MPKLQRNLLHASLEFEYKNMIYKMFNTLCNCFCLGYCKCHWLLWPMTGRIT